MLPTRGLVPGHRGRCRAAARGDGRGQLRPDLAPRDPGGLLTPPLVATLLVANLVPAMTLMVLFARRLTLKRASRTGSG